MLGTIDVRSEDYRLFTTIAIETSSTCNRKCAFCPVAYNPRPKDEYMSEELFKDIVSDLEALDYRGRVEFYIYNEPLRDKRIHHLIRYARSKLPKCCFMINTNGDYIKRWSDIVALFDVGINQLQINIYSDEDRAKAMECMVGQVLTRNLAQDDLSLYQNIGSKKRVVRVVRKFGITPDSPGSGNDRVQNRAGNIPTFLPPLDNPLKKRCYRPFRFLNVDWRGRGMLCCNDYTVQAKVGDAAVGMVDYVWNSDVFNIYRFKLQQKDRRLPVCDVCDFNGGSYAHVIAHVTFGEEIDNALRDADLRSKGEWNKAVRLVRGEFA